jgi:DNA-binding MarR family transcriptional regulator
MSYMVQAKESAMPAADLDSEPGVDRPDDFSAPDRRPTDLASGGLDSANTGPGTDPGNSDTDSEDPRDQQADHVATAVTRLFHVFNRARTQMLDRARDDVEWSAQLVISALVAHGPMRASALAEHLQSDPSTVSRQVAALVRDGMVERRPDPEDGRASQLAATERGWGVYQSHRRRRMEHFRGMLTNWTDAECEQLADLASRFTDDFEEYRSTKRPDRPAEDLEA